MKAKIINPTLKYDDSFYEEYVSGFVINQKPKIFQKSAKRIFDIFLSSILILLLALPFLVIGIIIKTDSKGHVFFANKRVGKNGKIFNCLKFRTMAENAPHDVATSGFTNSNEYITKFGHFLRKTSIDELPQIFNVFIGNMSFVGYRPLVLSEKKCNQMRQQLGVFRMKPGITGYAQVCGRDDVYYKNKAILDSIYTNSFSILFDLKIMVSTFLVVLSKKGNDDATNK